jgi:ribosomal protein L28
MDDGARVPFTQCHSTIDGQRLGIGNSVSSARNSSRKVNLANVARIEFLAITDEHKREMGVSPTQVFRSYGVRPANIRLNSGEELVFVFLETHLWNWYGPVMDGAFSEVSVVGVEFVRNEAQSRDGAA